MNTAHLHLVANHLPVVGLIVGTLVLVTGMLLARKEVRMTSYGIFVFSAVTSALAFYTGEGAEEIVENISGISETLIHNHEEYAETFFAITLLLGGISVVGFLLEWKQLKYIKAMATLILIVALANGVAAKYVGTSGGEIRHSEIRSETKMIPLTTHERDHDD